MKRSSRAFWGLAFVAGILTLSVSGQDTIPKSVSGGILNRKAVHLPMPEYPAEAKAAGLEGIVYVDVVIDESGTVISAFAATDVRKVPKGRQDGKLVEAEIQPADPILRAAAERAASEARFSPTLLSGNPVKVNGTIVFNFIHDANQKLDGGVLNGKATSLPSPKYPSAALAVWAAGTVVVQVKIDEEGNVIEAAALSGHPLLRASAVEAARAATFVPTRLDGQPVRVSGVLTYNFVVPKKDDNP